MQIQEFTVDAHRTEVIALWRDIFGYEAAHNDPGLVIQKKMEARDGLFFVAMDSGKVIGTILAGYDGHRGWLYSLAVAMENRRTGIGTSLVKHAEKELAKRGCMKINLQIMEGNEAVSSFYSKLGYVTEKRISMGKRIERNVKE